MTTVLIALITATGPVITLVVSQLFESKRTASQVAAARNAARAEFEQARSVRRADLLHGIRAAQVERVRDWISRQHVLSIDIAALNLSIGQPQLDPGVAAALRAHVGALLAFQSADPMLMSIEGAVAGLSDLPLIAAIRDLARTGDEMKAIYAPFAAFVAQNPLPWNDAQRAAVLGITGTLVSTKQTLDSKLAAVNSELEAYELGDGDSRGGAGA